MAPPAPVMAAIWPASGGSVVRRQLGLLRRPVLALEHLELADRLELARRLRIGDDGDGRLGDIGGDPRIGLAAAEAEEAEPRHQDDPRQRVEHGPRRSDARGVALEIGLVVGDELLRRPPRRDLEVVELAGLGRRHDQRPGLGADDVVGRHHAGAGVARDLLAVDEGADRLAAAELQHRPPPRAFDLRRLAGCRRRAGSAPPRPAARSPRCLGQRRRLEHRLAPPLQPRLGQSDHLDHALVGFAGRGAEGEDAVLVEDQALDLGRRRRGHRAALRASPKPGMT